LKNIFQPLLINKDTKIQKGEITMQDVQNIPNPDATTNDDNEEFGSHSDLHPETREGGIETPGKKGDGGEAVPLPPDRKPFPSHEDPAFGDDDDDRDLL
jgi:hypothetical protein